MAREYLECRGSKFQIQGRALIMWHPKAQFPAHLKWASVEEKNDYFSECFLLNHEVQDSCYIQAIKRIGRFKHWQMFHIFGPTGAGKTELADQLMDRIFEQYSLSGEKEGLPAVKLEVPNISTKVPDWKVIHKSFMRQINGFDFSKYRQQGRVSIDGKGRRFTGKHADEEDVQTAFKDMLADLNTSVVIMDEVQHLLKLEPEVVKNILDEFKSFSNLTKCQLVLVQTYESLENLSLNGQSIRRSRSIHFQRYRWQVPAEQKAFVDAYSGLLSHVPYELDKSLLSDMNEIEEVYANCCGCIGILKGLIEKAIFNLEKGDVLTPELLSSDFYNSDELMTLAKEIEIGEKYFKSDSSIEQVKQKLGMRGQSSKTAKTKGAKAGRKYRVGERKPVKDKVGNYAQ